MASTNAAELKPPPGPPPTSQTLPHAVPAPPLQVLSQQQQPQQQQELLAQKQPQQQQQQPSQQALQYYQHLLQPIGQQQPASPQLPSQQPMPQQHPSQRAQANWPASSAPSQAPPPSGLSPIGQWGAPCLPTLSSDLYSLGLVSTYMDSVMSEMLGHKPQGPRNNTWPNRDQSDGATYGSLGDTLPFDPAGE